MKKFLIAGSSLASVAAAGSVGAVDITLGGSIDMGIEFGVGKNQSSLQLGDAYNNISLSIGAAGTTDGGMKYGASFTLDTAAEIELNDYLVDGSKNLLKMTVEGATDLEAAVYNVSGGQAIPASNIVGVKINSSWKSVGATQTGYGLALNSPVSATNICKIAGRVESQHDAVWFDSQTITGNSVSVVTRGPGVWPSYATTRFQIGGSFAPSATGIVQPLLFKQTEAGDSLLAPTVFESGAYMPAGRMGQVISVKVLGTGSTATVRSVPPVPSAVVLTAQNGTGANIKVHLPTIVSSETIVAAPYTVSEIPVSPSNSTAGVGLIAVEFSAGNTILDAEVYAGPFAEVKLQSSSTKMVIGAVCVQGVEASETNYFLNNASKVVTASDATVFIEGGFGKLTLQTGDYAGGVAAIGDAGDAADLDVDGLALIIEGAGLIGMNPYIAVDLEAATLTDPSNLANLDILTGGTLNLGGLTAAVDVMLNAEDVLDITSWDLGLDYAMGDMAVSAAYDSTNAWGLSASMDVAGFGVDATIYNKAQEDHVKTGLYYSVAASTSLNGFGLSIGLDQDMQPTVDVTKDLGGLSLYAGYDAADEGGKIGATLSF